MSRRPQSTVLAQSKSELAGHTYYDGPGTLQEPDGGFQTVEPGRTLDLTEAPDGLRVQGGVLRQVAERTRWTHKVTLDPQECLALRRSTKGEGPALAPLDLAAIQRVR
ncbi:MAG: hypothetical protein PW734_03825 [Verrucomicrobium sp.]|nr:hypothetical protein [Verrucomicrobium sp.]